MGNSSTSPTTVSMEEKKTFESASSIMSYDAVNDDEENNARSAAAAAAASPGGKLGYDAGAIRAEFQTYHALLPKPDELLQKRHSAELLRDLIERHNNEKQNHARVPMPRFLRLPHQGGIKPHNALCCLLLDDFQSGAFTQESNSGLALVAWWVIWACTAGQLYPQLHIPADFIRDQFHRVAHVIPNTVAELVDPDELRLTIRRAGLPVPNFFLDPEDDKQFPPHIALLVILQESEKESQHLHNIITRAAWMVFAAVALLLRLVLEVIGGAGAVWGGSEVFYLRTEHNIEFWRTASILVGVFCFFRFVTLNCPQQEDEGDILGPAGPWSLRTAARLRAVCDHPFHYFCRGQAPYRPLSEKKEK